MRVRFSPEVVATEEHWWALSRILDCFEQDVHLWDVDDPRALQASPWIQGDAGSREGKRTVELLRKVLVRGLHHGMSNLRHSISLTVSLTEAPPHTLLPADALAALRTPAFVVVENGESDRAFLDCMMRAFGRENLAEALRKRLWEIVSAGGGGEIPKRVKECVPKMGKGPLRILILSDSDRLVPDERSKTVEQIERCAIEYGVAAVVLRKREIENYIPVGALQRVGPRNKVFRAYLALSPEQQDHYDMKKGLERDEKTGKPVIPEAQQGLFDTVNRRKAIPDLCGGFGKEVWRYFVKAADVIDECSIRNHCTPLAPDRPGSRDPDEIPKLLDAIERLL